MSASLNRAWSAPHNIAAITTTEIPNSTHDGTGGNVGPHCGGDVHWTLWIAVGGSALCFASVLLSYVVRLWMNRRGYVRLEGHRRQMMAFTQLLEEVRGRPRKVEPYEPLTDSERHFLVHDFADFP